MYSSYTALARLLLPCVALARYIVNRFSQLISAHGRALPTEPKEDTSSGLCAKVMFEYMERT